MFDVFAYHQLTKYIALLLVVGTAHADDLTIVASGFVRPWGLDFLEDGSPIVTELPGRLWKIENGRKIEIGFRYPGAITNLLDVAVDRTYIYFTVQTPSGLQVVRSQLKDNTTAHGTPVFQAIGDKEPRFAGGRLLLLDRDTLLVSIGDHARSSAAQDPTSHFGKIVRIDNASSEPIATTVALGVRNVQGMAARGSEIWFTDHGDIGNDALHLLVVGTNYGWPDGERPSAIESWTPAIAPSSLAFHDEIAFIGSLSQRMLLQLHIAKGRVTRQGPPPLLGSLQKRVRNVKVRAGSLWVLTDDGILISGPVAW